MERRCPNCDGPCPGRYCPSCGQDNARERLEWKAVVLDTFHTLVGWESSLMHTLRGLCLAPGGMVADYVDGRRRRYVNPARFCLLALALWFLSMQLSGLEALEASGINITSQSSAPGSPRSEFVSELRAFLGSNLQLLLYLTLPVKALFLRLAFRRSGRNLAENMALVLYLAGFGYALGVFTTPLLALGVPGARLVQMAIQALWFVRAVRVFHGRSWVASMLLGLLVGFSHMLATVVIFGAISVPVVLWRQR